MTRRTQEQHERQCTVKKKLMGIQSELITPLGNAEALLHIAIPLGVRTIPLFMTVMSVGRMVDIMDVADTTGVVVLQHLT